MRTNTRINALLIAFILCYFITNIYIIIVTFTYIFSIIVKETNEKIKNYGKGKI